MKKLAIALALSATCLFVACKKDPADPVVSTYSLPASATATWRGYLVTGYFNEGTIAVQSSNLQLSDGRVTGGTFRMPLSSIKNLNLPVDSLKEMLVHHLQSADFFNMALHPELNFSISKVEAIINPTDSANYKVSGDLSLLGKPLPITFPAVIRTQNDELSVAASIKVDRTRWGMNYATDPKLPADGRIINDISIDLRLKARKN